MGSVCLFMRKLAVFTQLNSEQIFDETGANIAPFGKGFTSLGHLEFQSISFL